ncbi:MAG TPA: prepilin-type N-terminal cleavage/methylation domain-containing protein [Candidatus Paceibacterota bacterium]|nr:prepilin-type N-terminal cleavage/methylation domain-containing protein [Candidatus Paceibacterota bacterium]
MKTIAVSALRKVRGFTLIELLVVIAIIGILVAIIVPNLSSAKASARDARRVSDIKNIQLSLALYYNDNQHYPCSLIDSAPPGNCAPTFATYMSSLPKDPTTGAYYVYEGQSNDSTMNADGQTCANKTVSYYHLGAIMETTSFMSQDDDKTLAQQIGYACQNGNSRFDGNATNCSGTSAASTDTCYDVAPN